MFSAKACIVLTSATVLTIIVLIRAYMELHGRPSTPVFPDSSPADSNFLAWRVASPAPVDQYRLLFRQVYHQARH